MPEKMITPSPLRHGDTVAIISPATTVNPAYIDGAAALLGKLGYKARVMPHAKGPACGTYAASDADRLADIREALADPAVKAIFCARGGYGCVHLLGPLTTADVAASPKWLVGFSDVSALHALWHAAGVRSLHAPMAKHLTELGGTHPASAMLLDMLARRSESFTIEAPAHPLNICGSANGQLKGGNLAVLSALGGTPFDMLAPEPAIIFVEDIGEKIYQVERMLSRLRLTGALDAAAAIIFGQFTSYSPDANFDTMHDMLAARLRQWGVSCPVAFGFPTGHVDLNYPLAVGSKATLSITPQGVTLTQHI